MTLLLFSPNRLEQKGLDLSDVFWARLGEEHPEFPIAEPTVRQYVRKRKQELGGRVALRAARATTMLAAGPKLPEADAAFNLLEFGFGAEAVPGGIGLHADQIGIVYAEVLFQGRQRRFLLAQVHIGCAIYSKPK